MLKKYEFERMLSDHITAMNINNSVVSQINDLVHIRSTYCVYILEIEPYFYKYGLSENIHDRVRTHYRDLNFIRIINIYDCGTCLRMLRLEKIIEFAAEMSGERTRKYNHTEVIHTHNIDHYLNLAESTLRYTIQPTMNQFNIINELVQIVDVTPKVDLVPNIPNQILPIGNQRNENRPKPNAAIWIAMNNPVHMELTTEYYQRYTDANYDMVANNQFGNLVRAAGFVVYKSNGKRHWKKG